MCWTAKANISNSIRYFMTPGHVFDQAENTLTPAFTPWRDYDFNSNNFKRERERERERERKKKEGNLACLVFSISLIQNILFRWLIVKMLVSQSEQVSCEFKIHWHDLV